MAQTIFFSWQIDTPPLVGRNLIERALERALARIEADTQLEEANRGFEIDRDTKGVSGTPPIVDTIFKKIDAAAVFLPDLTFVGKRLDGRPTPNPNVLIEYGWALNSLGHSRMMPVMNTAFGEPKTDDMPFDMRHLRYPILYSCPEDASDDERRQARENLAKDLERAIRAVLTNPELRREAVIVAPPKFTARTPVAQAGMFRDKDEALGVSTHYFGSNNQIYLEEGPALWLRVMPDNDQGGLWPIDELEQASTQNPFMQPLNKAWSGLGHFRGHDGFGVYASGDKEKTYGVAYIFRTGEIWSIDTFMLNGSAMNGQSLIFIRERDFDQSISEYAGILRKIGVTGNLRWIAGMSGVKGRSIFTPSQSGYVSFGPSGRGSCMLDEVIEQGTFDPDNIEPNVLKPFYQRVYESCGVRRPDWLDQQQPNT